MNRNYLKNIKNIKPQTAAEPQQQRLQPIADVSEQQEDVWPKESIYDIDLASFIRASYESTDRSIREAMAYLNDTPAVDAAEAASASFGGGGQGYGTVVEPEPAYEVLPDQF